MTIKNISFLENLQNTIEKKLNNNPSFENIPVIAHRQDDLDNCLQEFLDAGSDLCILVMNPLPTTIKPRTSQVSFEHSLIRIQIIDSGFPNVKKMSALAAAEFVSHSLHNFRPDIQNWSGCLKIDTKLPWREINDPQHLGRYILEVRFHTYGAKTQTTHHENTH